MTDVLLALMFVGLAALPAISVIWPMNEDSEMDAASTSLHPARGKASEAFVAEEAATSGIRA